MLYKIYKLNGSVSDPTPLSKYHGKQKTEIFVVIVSDFPKKRDEKLSRACKVAGGCEAASCRK